MKKRTKADNLFDITFGIIFIISVVQIPWQASVIEVLPYTIWMSVSIYHITKYLSLNLLQKAMRRKRFFVFILQFIVCSLLITFMSYLFRYGIYLLEKAGHFQPSAFFKIEFTPVDFLGLFFFMGVMTNLCFCAIGFYVGYSNLDKEHTEAQLKMLQAQITPHFMFNVLNHINVLMQKDVDAASELLINYSNVLRHQLYSGKEAHIPIEQEVQFLKEFVYVEETRWKDKIDVNCKWEIENRNIQIPSALLIVFVENAFKHVSRSDTEKGYINIELEQVHNMISLIVENSKSEIQSKPQKKTDSGIGLKNIQSRLNILYPGRHNLTINETGGTYYTKLEINL